MSWLYSFSSDIWPALITLALAIILGSYSWRRRSVPGAKAFAIGCLFATLWVLGSVLEIAATDFSTKVFWLKFQAIWQLPTITSITIDDATGDNVQVQAGVRGPKMPAFDEIKDDIDSIYIDSKDMQNYKNGKQVRGLYILVRC